jgi:hypothetical protein
MSDLALKVGVVRYDRCEALFDGSVRIADVDATFESSKIVTDIFKRMIVNQEFDVAELGWTYYLRTLDFDEPPFIAIPVFPNRVFRHSAIYVNTSSGIATPQDLVGKTIGEFATYGHDAGFWPKGILADDFGLKPEQSRWIVGGLDFPMPPVDFIPFLHPDDVDVTMAPDGADLGVMLENGEIDALISADVPQSVLNRSPNVRQLFPDYKQVEQDYYRRTGIFPIMHTVVMRRELIAAHPDLPRVVYNGFCDAKDHAMRKYRFGRIFNHINIMVPWFSELFDEDRDFFAEDWWPYGIDANRAAVDTLLRYHHEQGLSRRRLTCEDVFVADLLDT